MKLTIKGNISVKAYTSKAGKPYKKASFKVHEEVLGTQDLYISGFYRSVMDTWQDGTIIDVEVNKEIVNDKVYLNFSLPEQEAKKPIDIILSLIDKLNDEEMETLNNICFERRMNGGQSYDRAEDTIINPDDLPF